MAKQRDTPLNPLRPGFPPQVVAEITEMRGCLSRARLDASCRPMGGDQGIDLALVRVGAAVAQTFFDAKVIKGNSALPPPPSTYPIENAASVALLRQDNATPTRAESVLAALVEQIIAYEPAKAEPMKQKIVELLQQNNALTDERVEAVDAAFKLASQVARISRMPRLFIENPDLPEQAIHDTREMALAMPDARALTIKLCEAMNRLRHFGNDTDAVEKLRLREKNEAQHDMLKKRQTMAMSRHEKEALSVLTFAKKVYAPLAEAIGWDAAKAKIEDYIFAYEQPKARKDIITAVEAHMGEGFFDSGRELVASGTHFISQIVNKALNEGNPLEEPVKFSVQGRVKQPVSFWHKMEKKGYASVADVPDPLGFRIVLVGDNLQRCYDVLNKALKRAFNIDPEHTEDHISSDKRPDYQSIHIVTGVKSELHRIAVDVPAELLGKKIEIQVRDEEMDRAAEIGKASHLGYKMGNALSANHTALMAQVRSDLAMCHAGKPMQGITTPDVFVLQPDGQPRRIKSGHPAGIGLLDALAAINPGYIYARRVVLNGVSVAVDNPETTKIRIENGDSLKVDTDSINRRQPLAQGWYDAEVTTTELARAALAPAVPASSRRWELPRFLNPRH